MIIAVIEDKLFDVLINAETRWAAPSGVCFSPARSARWAGIQDSWKCEFAEVQYKALGTVLLTESLNPLRCRDCLAAMDLTQNRSSPMCLSVVMSVPGSPHLFYAKQDAEILKRACASWLSGVAGLRVGQLAVKANSYNPADENPCVQHHSRHPEKNF